MAAATFDGRQGANVRQSHLLEGRHRRESALVLGAAHARRCRVVLSRYRPGRHLGIKSLEK